MPQRINLSHVNIAEVVDLCHIDNRQIRRTEPGMIIRIGDTELSGTVGQFRELAGQIGLRAAEVEQVARPHEHYANLGVSI